MTIGSRLGQPMDGNIRPVVPPVHGRIIGAKALRGKRTFSECGGRVRYERRHCFGMRRRRGAGFFRGFGPTHSAPVALLHSKAASPSRSQDVVAALRKALPDGADCPVFVGEKGRPRGCTRIDLRPNPNDGQRGSFASFAGSVNPRWSWISILPPCPRPSSRTHRRNPHFRRPAPRPRR
jgi:hypothetical protein